MKFRIAIFITCVSVFSSGCSSLSLNKKNLATDQNTISDVSVARNNQSNPTALASRQGASVGAARMAVIWKEKVLNFPAQPPVRGFAGRILFYDSNDQLVRVDGELSVYGYDDSQEFQSEVADSKYVFPAERFQDHYSESELGPAYSVWVPWENKDGIRKSVTLVPVFKTVDNHVIQGGTNRLTLSGKAPATVERTLIERYQPSRSHAAQSQANYQMSDSGARSISVPRTLANRMTQAEAARYSAKANEQLDRVMSSKENPKGELFNRTTIQNFQSPYGEQQSIPTGHLANFNDVAQAAAAINAQQNQDVTQPPPVAPVSSQSKQPLRVFGQPGPIR